MATSQDISTNIRAQLHVLDPDISAEPLTPERKIIDAVSDVIAGGVIDQTVLNYNLDIDTKSGSDLDKFVALFGFARQGGKSATGTVTFSRAATATTDVQISAGTQVYIPSSSISVAIFFQTTASVTLFQGNLSVDAPIEAVVAGAAGNVPANSITGLQSIGTSQVSTVSNVNATSGGTEQETDDALRVRIKNTIFRNIAGTSDQYLALALSSRFTNKANVIGPISRFVEYLQIEGGAATSFIPYSKWTYATDYYLTDGNIANEFFYAPRGIDYTFNNPSIGGNPATTTPPTIYVNDDISLPDDTVVLLEHSYCSANSRNDPNNNISNYVDVFISGQEATDATESTVVPSQVFASGGGGILDNTHYERYGTQTNPTAGNNLQWLLWQPVISIPGQIVVDDTTYTEGTDYWFVKDTTLSKGSRVARDGIEWNVGLSLANTPYTFTYVFDQLPMTLNELMDSHKQIATDVSVHGATLRYFIIYLTVMYTPGFSTVSVDQAITTSLAAFFASQQFGAVMQLSDLLEEAHEVPGVDNIRITQAGEAVSFGIQEVTATGGDIQVLTEDFPLQDSDLPVLNSIVTIRRSQNTWAF